MLSHPRGMRLGCGQKGAPEALPRCCWALGHCSSSPSRAGGGVVCKTDVWGRGQVEMVPRLSAPAVPVCLGYSGLIAMARG